jgi:hypothetical protein
MMVVVVLAVVGDGLVGVKVPWELWNLDNRENCMDFHRSQSKWTQNPRDLLCMLRLGMGSMSLRTDGLSENEVGVGVGVWQPHGDWKGDDVEYDFLHLPLVPSCFVQLRMLL